MFKEKLRTFNLELRNARQSFFSDIITKNSNNVRALFAAVDRLTNPPVAVASEHLSTRACNEFASFFTEKIHKIRQAVQSIPGSRYVLSLYPFKMNSDAMTVFSDKQEKPG